MTCRSPPRADVDNDDVGNASGRVHLPAVRAPRPRRRQPTADCLGLCREIGTDHVINGTRACCQNYKNSGIAKQVPERWRPGCTARSSRPASRVAAGCASKMLTAHPCSSAIAPEGPGAGATKGIANLVDSLCELRGGSHHPDAVSADVSDQNVGEHVVERRELNNWAGREQSYPGVDASLAPAPADGELDPKALFAPHVALDRRRARTPCTGASARWVNTAWAARRWRMRTARRTGRSKGSKGGRAMARRRGPALLGVLADADRLLLQKIGAARGGGRTGRPHRRSFARANGRGCVEVPPAPRREGERSIQPRPDEREPRAAPL